MPNNDKVGPPPSSVADTDSASWKNWFNKIHESTSLNKNLSHIVAAANTTADKEAIIIATSNITITLPAASDSEDRNYYIKRATAAGTVTISSSDNIDGSATYTLDENYDAVQLFCDGSTWHVIVEPVPTIDLSPYTLAAASSTDNAIARFDGTGGDTIQNSGVIVDDSDNLYGHGSKVIEATGTTRTLTGTDNGCIVVCTHASGCTVTLPQTSTETIAAGFQCVVVREGAGAVSFAVQGSDTLNSADSLTDIRAQYGSAAIYKRTAGSPNTWYAWGDLA